MANIVIPLAHGVEEMEAVICLDVFRRAKWTVVAAGLHAGVVVASRGVRLVPDATWSETDPSLFDALVLPGGADGTQALSQDAKVLATVRRFMEAGKLVAAVCAAPLVLQAAGVLEGRTVTCHPAVAARLMQGQRLDDAVVVDGNLITSQGPGTTFAFALAVVRALDGVEQADALARALLYPLDRSPA